MLYGLRFHKSIGSDVIYKRIHELARIVYERAAKIPQLQLLTPNDDRMFGSLTTFNFRGADVTKFWELCGKRRIWIAKSANLRVSTHIHTRPSDIDALFQAIDETMLGKKAKA
jgi:selenocysteine lyase/cysteine desulfurase